VLWRSLFGGRNVSNAHLFEQLADVPVVGGKVTLSLEADAMYTLSTMRTATKVGGTPVSIPQSAPFPLPYSDEFESKALSTAGKFWSDMDGGFEIAKSASSPTNQVLKQTVARKACCNFIPSLDGPLPFSIIGSSTWVSSHAILQLVVMSRGFSDRLLIGGCHGIDLDCTASRCPWRDMGWSTVANRRLRPALSVREWNVLRCAFCHILTQLWLMFV
jgi:galactosylceramidase